MNPRTDADHTPGADAPSEWLIRQRTGEAHGRISAPPDTPPPRAFNGGPLVEPGKPGTGKSTLPHAVAHELGPSQVLHWPVTSRTVPGNGLYHYDTIARQNSQIASRTRGTPASGLDSHIRLGQPGSATLPTAKPRLLLDEFDKNDNDLPNDLLNIPEEGESTTNAPRRAAVARRAPPHPPRSTMNDLPLPRFLGRTGSGRPTRKSALPGELPMPDQDPTPATHTPNTTNDTYDTESRIVSFRWPSKPALSTGACFTYAFSLGGLLATGRISDPTRAWQLVVLAVTSMTCGAILAITQRTHRRSGGG
ncbi:hypothetical protein ACFYRG_46895 [Streptomyces mirabilis]|uniref:hypothetical protein n=1 Tax=Streptomyces mirabilis TaxID=68239 RepID=UPI0036CCA9A6